MASRQRAGTSNKGGHKFEFVSPVPDMLICPTCHLPAKNPVVFTCLHRFCKTCTEEMRPGMPWCPADRRPIARVGKDMVAFGTLQLLFVKCPNDKCTWTGRLKSVQRHLGMCPRAPHKPAVGGELGGALPDEGDDTNTSLKTLPHLSATCSRIKYLEKITTHHDKALEELSSRLSAVHACLRQERHLSQVPSAEVGRGQHVARNRSKTIT